MGLNKNHEVEEFNGVRCAIVEKNADHSRMQFLKKLLEFNKYKVEVVSAAAPKTAAAPVAAEGANPEAAATPTPPTSVDEKFNVGVTDLSFNPINAIFGRLLKTPDGHIVTLAYWQQKENISHDEVPYYENK